MLWTWMLHPSHYHRSQLGFLSYQLCLKNWASFLSATPLDSWVFLSLASVSIYFRLKAILSSLPIDFSYLNYLLFLKKKKKESKLWWFIRQCPYLLQMLECIQHLEGPAGTSEITHRLNDVLLVHLYKGVFLHLVFLWPRSSFLIIFQHGGVAGSLLYSFSYF
jgi:hypothetical protein